MSVWMWAEERGTRAEVASGWSEFTALVHACLFFYTVKSKRNHSFFLPFSPSTLICADS